MAKAPDGAVVGDLFSDDEDRTAPTGEPERQAGECRDPNLMGGAGAVGSAGAVLAETALPNIHADLAPLKIQTLYMN